MKDNVQNLRGKTLEESIAITKEALEGLKTSRFRQEEALASLRKQSEDLERKLQEQPAPEEIAELGDEVFSASPVFGYGAEMIGRTVLQAALYCNRLTGDGSEPSAKELVNLILGKAEIVKAEMLKIILSDQSPQEKRIEIDRQFEQAKDYFESVLYQTK